MADSIVVDKSVQESLTELETMLRRGKYRSSQLAAKTLDLVDEFIQSHSWTTAGHLITWLTNTMETLKTAARSETASGNLILRIIKNVQDDYTTHTSDKEQKENPVSTTTRFSLDDEARLDSYDEPELRLDVQNTIKELKSELESCSDNIAEEAENHIYANEVVLTMGHSLTVEAFLKKAAKKQEFEVIVAECSPTSKGQELACSLASSKIHTILIADTAIFAMMSRVHKVVIGTHSVLANGGLKAIAGVNLVAMAAKYYNVPVIVLTPMYKLTPEYPLSTNIQVVNRFNSPEQLIDYASADMVSQVCVYNPVFDYVSPDLVSLFIFNNEGSHSPSYIYRLLRETYYPQIKIT